MSTATEPTLTVYVAPGCHLCHEALARLEALREELGFELRERDITRDDALHRAYLERIPVVAIGEEELFEYFVDPGILRERLAGWRAAAGAEQRSGDAGRAGTPR